MPFIQGNTYRNIGDKMRPTLVTSLCLQLLCIYNPVRSQDYVGCFEDSGNRMLGHYTTFSAQTLDMCIDYCQRLGYKFAGLQYRTYCFCGVEAPANLKKPDTDCNMDCPGNRSETCGGTWRNSVYKIKNVKKAYDYLGCYKDENKPRALSGFYNYFNNLSPNECIELCKGLGYLYAGLQAAIWCFCGNELDLSNERPDGECNLRCTGESQRMCGGLWRNSIYFTGAYSGPSSEYEGTSCKKLSAPLNGVKSCSSETCTITCLEDYAFPDGSTTVNISCVSGRWKPSRSDWSRVPDCKVTYGEYLGCYVDSGNRMLGHYTTFTAQTPDMCIDYCYKLGFKFAGLQFWTFCFCGVEAPDKLETRDSDCSVECPGDSSEKCGGIWRNSVYKIKNPKKGYEYLGCYKDQHQPRALSGFYNSFNNLSPFQCITFCKTLGYAYAGLQAGTWCFCGNQLQPSHERVGDSECSSLCSGDSQDMCGGVWRNSIYFIGLTATCTSPCHNGGTCVSPDNCSCPKDFYGPTCEMKGCTEYPSTPANSIKSCDSEKCTITCLDNYKFPDGSVTAQVSCKAGKWEPDVSDCKATCTLACQNGGTCVSPNTCACPQDFYGTTCEKTSCSGYPSTPANSIKYCESENCTITCLANYKFPDGSVTAQVSCKAGKLEPAVSDCKATCTLACQNGGTCVSTNTCVCPQDYYGPTCETMLFSGYPSTPANSIKSCESENCTITCLDNYKFPDGSVTAQVLCKDGKWEPAVSDCKATCTSSCQNGGTCVSPNTCSCPQPFYGPTCEMWGCTPFPSMPANSIKSCDSEKCTITCLDNYKFPDGSVTAQVLCKAGKWEPAVSDCQATCTSPCQNGRTCVSRNTCACPQDHYGPTCEKKRCSGYPPTPANSIKSCVSARCTITCLQNYAFPGGSTAVNVSCENGVWVPSTANWSSTPDCKENLKQYLGCYEEPLGSKMMGYGKRFQNVLTPDACSDYCRSLGSTYFGLQYRHECYCGDVLPDIKMKVNDSKCDLPCSGDSTQICGAHERNSVYKILKSKSAFSYEGCYSDDSGSSLLLQDYYKFYDRLIPFQCSQYCKEKGSEYTGPKTGSRLDTFVKH